MPGDLFSRVSEYVDQHPGCTPSDVAAAVPAIRGATAAVLRRLERAGFVEHNRRTGTYRSFKLCPLAMAGTAVA